mgnify:CR=1 FL=1
MVTIAHLVENSIRQRPFLQEALSRGIVNNAALAEELIPQIEKELGKPVKFSAVNLAIRRLNEKLGQTFIRKAKFDKDSDIMIRSDLVEITVYKEDVQEFLKKVYDVVDLRKGDFLTITQGLNEVMIITNKKNEHKITELFPKKLIKKLFRNLSSLTINIPPEAVGTIGLFYIVTRALNWENINITDIVSTFTEMTYIVDEKDTARAFNVLKKLIEENN